MVVWRGMGGFAQRRNRIMCASVKVAASRDASASSAYTNGALRVSTRNCSHPRVRPTKNEEEAVVCRDAPDWKY